MSVLRAPLDALVAGLPPWVIVGGKGGVGKTTCAAALASRSASEGARTLLLSTDPALTLGAALGVPLTGRASAVPGHAALAALQLDPVAARADFLARWREVLVTILDRGTYLERAEVAGLVDAALPGLDETMALLTLLDLADGGWARLVIDTAPTGHALRLLELPAGLRAMLALLDTMQEKHRFMVRALTHRDRADDADAFLQVMRERVAALERTLTEPARSAVVLVARAEDLVVEETARYAAALERLRLAVRAVVVNALPVHELSPAERTALDALRAIAPGAVHVCVPRLDPPPVALAGIERWGASMMDLPAVDRSLVQGGADTASVDAAVEDAAVENAAVENAAARSRAVGDVPAPRATPSRWARRAPHAPRARPATRALTIVAGKGGVGKTTVACALGISIATPQHRVLVVSTDPAPSVADALAQPVGDDTSDAVGDAIGPVRGAAGLFAQQLDASRAFARFRDRYAARVDELFDGLIGGGMDAAHDRRIARDLLALAPPGIDELYALAALGEHLAAGEFATVIVDPAPTGHLLRLLELPAIALDWSHRLLRLMLEYKQVIALGGAAEEVLAFARRTRALGALVHDPARAGVIVVTLDEPLVRTETERLGARLAALGVDVIGTVWNRAVATPAPLPPGRAGGQFEAMLTEPPPRGVDALRRWADQWRPLFPSTADG